MLFTQKKNAHSKLIFKVRCC